MEISRRIDEFLNTTTWRVMGLSGERVAFGIDSSVWKARRNKAVKVYDQPMARGINIYVLKNYQMYTAQAVKEVKGLEIELGGERWRVKVNPIIWAGLIKMPTGVFPCSTSPWVDGQNISVLFANGQEKSCFGGDTFEKVRLGLDKISKYFRYKIPLANVDLAPTNVKVDPEKRMLIVTDIRAKVLKYRDRD